jgi:hypothetical protein
MFRRLIASLLILSLVLPFPAHAGLIGVEDAAQRGRITAFLERAEVQAQLQARGIGAADAKARVAALSDAEAAELAARIDSLPAGGDVGLLGAIVLIFLVLLLTDILGFTKIFPFTKPVR